MKKLILTLALLASPMAFAENVTPADFYGKYLGVDGDCVDTRVYIGKGTYAGHDALQISYYTDDATGDQLVLGSGEMQVPGTIPSIHGEVIQTWKTTANEDSIVSKTTIERPSISLVRTTGQILQLLENGNVAYAEYFIHEDETNDYTKYCELERQ